MLVIDSQRSRWPVLDLATAATAGGVDAIYLRGESIGPPPCAQGEGFGGRAPEVLVASVLHQHLDHPIALLTNEEWEDVRPTNVGLHLRERDPLPTWAPGDRQRPALIGRSVHSPESARTSTGVDYVLAGHVFHSASKPGKPPLGLARLARIVSAAPCPVIAIGGITANRVAEVLHAGAYGVAVIGAIAEVPDPYLAARSLRAAIDDTLLTQRKESTMQLADTATQKQAGSTIEIVVNGKNVHVPEQSTIHDFLASKRMTGAMAIVERNGEIVPRGDYATTRVAPGDTIEVVHAVGGG